MLEVDRSLLLVLYRLYGSQVYEISVLVGREIEYVQRRLRELQRLGFVGSYAAFGGEKNVYFLKKKGMRRLIEEGCEVVEKREHAKSSSVSRHVQGEARVAAWLALPKEAKKSGMMRIPFGVLWSERDLRTLSFDGVGSKLINKEKGLHMPDFAYVGQKFSVAIEYERTLKPKTAMTQTRDNARKNATRFDHQIWIVESLAIKKQVAEATKNLKGVVIVLMSDVMADLNAYTPTKSLLGSKFIAPKPLRDIRRVIKNAA